MDSFAEHCCHSTSTNIVDLATARMDSDTGFAASMPVGYTGCSESSCLSAVVVASVAASAAAGTDCSWCSAQVAEQDSRRSPTGSIAEEEKAQVGSSTAGRDGDFVGVADQGNRRYGWGKGVASLSLTYSGRLDSASIVSAMASIQKGLSFGFVGRDCFPSSDSGREP